MKPKSKPKRWQKPKPVAPAPLLEPSTFDIPFSDEEMRNVPLEGAAEAERAEQRARGSTASTLGAGVPPSNTTPANSVITPLRCGEDSLYLSYQGHMYEEMIAELEKRKGFGQSQDKLTQAMAQLPLGDHIFEVRPHGGKRYPFIISDYSFHMQLSSGAGSLPMAYVRLGSEFLSHAGTVEAKEHLTGLMEDLVHPELGYLVPPKVSRVDMFVDFAADFPFESLSRTSFVSRARKFDRFEDGDAFTGITIGRKGSISFRLYDKTEELKLSKKDYLKGLWKVKSWDGESPVWRAEFQIKRSALTQLGIDSFESYMAKREQLWLYLTTSWLRMVDEGEHQSRDRWPTSLLWQDLQNVFGCNYLTPLTRQYSSKSLPSDSYLYSTGLSGILGFMAIHDHTNIRQAVDEYITAARNYHYHRGSFETYIERKVAQKRKQYNLLNTPTHEPEEEEV